MSDKVKARVLDFTGVEDKTGGFRPRRKREGDYYGTIKAVGDHTSKADNDMWVFTITVDGDSRATYPYYCGFEAKELWKVRALCVAAGIKVPSGKAKLDPTKLVGRGIGMALVDDEYDGKIKSTIDGVMPAADLEDAMNEPSGKSASTKAKSRQAEEDDDEDDDDEEEPAPKKSSKKKKPEPEPDEDDEDDDSDDDDEDDEPPAKKSKSKASKRSKDDDDDDEDDDDDSFVAAVSRPRRRRAAARPAGPPAV